MPAAINQTLTDCQAYQPRREISGPAAEWFFRMIGRWRGRARERKAFALMNARDLRDIGVSRWEVERELAKPFWRG